MAAGPSFVVSNGANRTSAMFVKPTLRDSLRAPIGYVAFTNAFFWLLPSAAATFSVALSPVPAGAVHVCAEACNAPRVCLIL